MENPMGALLAAWNEWEIRVLVLTSLALQVFLLFSAGIRKRNVSALLGLLLWLAYLLADSIAIYALGYLSQTRVPKGVDPRFFDRAHRIQAFWAPFLLLHLGGQDTITAFSIEDNELWKRHLLSLLSQVALAVYVFAKSRPDAAILYPAVFMFLSGILKYGERTWALKCASMDNLRSGMVTTPDPGPNYASFMEKYRFTREAGLQAEIVIEPERRAGVTAAAIAEESVPYATVITDARRFFGIFKRLFVNLILSFQDRTRSQATFLRLTPEQAYKIIEIELSLMYDSLHSKAAVIHTWYGRLLRCTTLLSTSTACFLFNALDKDRYEPYDGTDICITNVLFGGALCLEVYAIVHQVFPAGKPSEVVQSDGTAQSHQLLPPGQTDIAHQGTDSARAQRTLGQLAAHPAHRRVSRPEKLGLQGTQGQGGQHRQRRELPQVQQPQGPVGASVQGLLQGTRLERRGGVRREHSPLAHRHGPLLLLRRRRPRRRQARPVRWHQQSGVKLHAFPSRRAPVHADGRHRADSVRGHLRGGQELLRAGVGEAGRASRGEDGARGERGDRAEGREGGQEQVGAVRRVPAGQVAAGAAA